MRQRILSFFRRNKGKNLAGNTELSTLISQARKEATETHYQKQVLELLTHNIESLVWLKRWDVEEEAYFYEFANKPHCHTFFGIPENRLDECVSLIKDKDDLELLNAYRERTGLQHTYGDICLSTDVHARDEAIKYHQTGGKHGSLSCTYLECGYVGNNELILQITKTSLFHPAHSPSIQSHTYSVGNAINVTEHCDSKLEYAKQLIRENQARRLSNGVFWLFPQKDTCNLLETEMQG
jgi:hypothetical protein